MYSLEPKMKKKSMDYIDTLMVNHPISLFRDLLYSQQGMIWFSWKRNFRVYTKAEMRSESI